MKYRQAFNVSWQEVMDMPVEVFWQDLDMMEIEQEVVAMEKKGGVKL